MKNPSRVSDNNFDRLQAHQGLNKKNNSQMSHISENGISYAAAEREDASVKAKLEIRLSRLTKLQGHITNINLALSSLSLLDKESRLKTLSSSLKKMITLRDHPNLPHGCSKPLRAACNELISIREGVFLKASTDRRNVALFQIEKVLAAVKQMITSTQESLVMSSGNEDESQQKLFDRAKELINQSNKESKRLEAIKRKPVVLDRVPIVPATKAPIDTVKLNSMGIKNDNLGGYALIHSQMVIGINGKHFKEEKEKNNDKKIKYIDVVKRYLKVFAKSIGRELKLVSDQGVMHEGGIWYWIADERTINALMNSSKGHLKILNWGFGFSKSEDLDNKSEN